MKNDEIKKSITRWYTYHLVDPITYTVFYVGKGKGPRMKLHTTRALRWRKTNYANTKVNKHLYYKLLQLHDLGLEPIYDIVFESFIEIECLNREMDDIKKIGIDNLCNITHGGEGGAKTAETLALMANRIREFWNSERGQLAKNKMSKERMGENNPCHRRKEKETDEQKEKRMAPMLAKPRWNTGLKNDPRSKGPKGTIPHNSRPCIAINKLTGETFESISKLHMSILIGVPLVTICRMLNRPHFKSKRWNNIWSIRYK